MNIREYLVNPIGKGSSILMLSNARKSLDEQYYQIRGRIRVKWYELNEKYYIAHVQIPSRTHEKLFYDVLLEFDIDTILSNRAVLNDGNVRVFSNCPSFTYTYANVFDKKRDLIDWAKKKYTEEIFSKDPVTRNPHELRSYEKSLYFASKYILSNGRNYVRSVKTLAIRVKSHRDILSKIRSNTEIEDLYKSYSAQKKKQADLEKKNQEFRKRQEIRQKKQPKKSSGIVKSTKTTSSIKTTRKTKKTKKI